MSHVFGHGYNQWRSPCLGKEGWVTSLWWLKKLNSLDLRRETIPEDERIWGKRRPRRSLWKIQVLDDRHEHCDIMLCKMFKTYLKGNASIWYRSMKPRSIGSYDQLKSKFLRHYCHISILNTLTNMYFKYKYEFKFILI